MKWLTLMLCATIWCTAQSQTGIWTGGHYDGGSVTNYNNTSQFNIWAGTINDGAAVAQYSNTNSLNIWSGGKFDGAGLANYINPSTFTIWQGGTADGSVVSSFVNTNRFNIWAGGINDGSSLSAYVNTSRFNIWNGGYGDGGDTAQYIAPPVSVCGNPVIIQQTEVSNITKYSATFSWTTFNPGTTTSYIVWVRVGGINGTIVRSYSNLCAANLNTLNITGLAPGTYYCISLQEHCSAGVSTGVSANSCFTTYPEDCPSPTVLQHLGNSGSTIRLGWTAGQNSFGELNTNYEIMLVKMSSTDTFRFSGLITGSQMRDTLECLPASTFFNYQIREGCGYGRFGPWVNGFSTYTSPRCSAPDSQAGAIVNTQNANLSWYSIYSDETSKPYQISYGVGITDPAQGTLTPVTTITPAQVSGNTRTHALFVSGGVGNVTWFVREVCGMCDTTIWSGPHTLPATTCNVPNVNNMSTSSITTTSAIVSWLSTNYNSTATIELHDQTTGTYSYYNAGAGVGYNRTATISGLFANTVYDWRVKEYCTSGDSTAYSVAKQFTTPGGGSGNSCAAPTNQGIFVTSGNVLIVKWQSPLYLDGTKNYEIAAGMNITSPAQATIQQTNGYYWTQSPTFPTHFFANGNTPGFTWFVRDECSPGVWSSWLGPYVMGSSSKTDETGATEITETPVENVELHLYPNPNNGKGLTVKTNMTGTSTITIYNLQGQLVAQQLLNANGVTSLDVAVLADAVYTCHVTNGQLTKTIRLVIQR